MKKEAQLAIELVETLTSQGSNIETDHGLKVLERYMVSLDPLRLFFSKTEYSKLSEKYGNSLWQVLSRNGDLTACFDVLTLYQSKVAKRVTWINDFLNSELELESDLSYSIAHEARMWPASEPEANNEWTKRLIHEILREHLQGVSIDEARALLQARYRRIGQSVSELSTSQAHDIFVNALFQTSDTDSSYFSHTTVAALQGPDQAERVGIGLMLSKPYTSEFCEIAEILPNGPADRNGMLSLGDKVVSVKQADSPTADSSFFSLQELTKLTAGPPSSELTLTVAPRSYTDAPRKIVTLTRNSPEPQRASALICNDPGNNNSDTKIGVIKLPSFYSYIHSESNKEISAAADLQKLLKQMKVQNAEALVLDLRDNQGGLFDESFKTAELFIAKAPILQMRKAQGGPSIIKSQRRAATFKAPIVVLVSSRSASAAEVLTGALKHHGKAIIVGDNKTAGAGNLSQFFSLKPYIPNSVKSKNTAGHVRISVGALFLPNGSPISKTGIQSDILIQSLHKFDSNNSPLDSYSKLKAASKPNYLSTEIVETLRDLSEERQRSNKAMIAHNQYADWLEKQSDTVSISLNESERIKVLSSNENMDSQFQKAIQELDVPRAMIQMTLSPEKPDSGIPVTDGLPLTDSQLEEAVRIAIDSTNHWSS